jgi:hypothetical protein
VKKSGPPTLFCDLDGVLCDFEAGVLSLTGKAPAQLTPAAMWSRLARSPEFCKFDNYSLL